MDTMCNCTECQLRRLAELFGRRLDEAQKEIQTLKAQARVPDGSGEAAR